MWFHDGFHYKSPEPYKIVGSAMRFLYFAPLRERRCSPKPAMTCSSKGGHVIDPKNKISAVRDVAIRDGLIAAVARDIPAAQARKVVNVSGLYVTPGVDRSARARVRRIGREWDWRAATPASFPMTSPCARESQQLSMPALRAGATSRSSRGPSSIAPAPACWFS